MNAATAAASSALSPPPDDVLELPGHPAVRRRHAAGYAYQIDVADVIPYDAAYWQTYLDYADSPLDGPLNAHRVALAGKYCRRVLDVGIGCGRFLESWLSQGDDGPYARTAAGTDVNHVAEGWLRSHGLWHDADRDGVAGFDGICLWDVLEHMPDPGGFPRRVLPGQHVILSLPIARDFRRLAEWRHYKPREHLHHWTHDGLVEYFRRLGFRCVESDDAETRLGRCDIRSYVFRRLYAGEAAPRPGRAVLVTNGLGDFLAIESHWTIAERSHLETLYYATPSEPLIREVIAAMPWARRPLHQVTLWDEWDPSNAENDRRGTKTRPPRCFVCAEEVSDYVRVPPGVEDLSIAEQFPRFTESRCSDVFFGSSALRGPRAKIAGAPPYIVIHPETDDAEPGRNFDASDWNALYDYCGATGRHAIVVGTRAVGPAGAWLTNVPTTPPQSIDLLRGAAGFFGIDSWLSVLAAQLFAPPHLGVKCRREQRGGGIAWRHVYWRPRAAYLQPLDQLPWLGGSIAEILRRGLGVGG